MKLTINKVLAREVLDSRGFPTVEVEVFASTSSGKTPDSSADSIHEFRGQAIVPSGASTGEGEALELRDQDKARYLGKGVLKAVENVRTKIAPSIVGRSFNSFAALDEVLLDLDGTENKTELGANAILPVSMAFARALANSQAKPLYQLIAETFGSQGQTLPVPLMNILNGGKHADNGLAIQEFMIVPVGFKKFSESLRAGAEVFHHLKKVLNERGLATGVGDEGGFAPHFSGEKPHEQAMQSILTAIKLAGYQAGRDIYLALDCAASEFYQGEAYQFEGKRLNSSEMVQLYSQWVETYPIISIEDGLAEHDWKGWAQATTALGGKCQLVGDDLFVTNPKFLKKGIEQKTANSILIKLNQIGTLSETLSTMKLAKQNNYASIASHRSGESEDTFIAELAVGTDCGQIKTGSASRTDRIAKYNQLIRIQEALGENARFAGMAAFKREQRSVV